MDGMGLTKKTTPSSNQTFDVDFQEPEVDICFGGRSLSVDTCKSYNTDIENIVSNPSWYIQSFSSYDRFLKAIDIGSERK